MASTKKTRALSAFVFLVLALALLATILVTCFPEGVSARPNRQPSVSNSSPPPQPQPREPSIAADSAAGRSARESVIPPARVERPEPIGRMAVIIDDAGYSLEDLQPFLEFDGPMAIAVLPNLPHSTEAARRVLAAGKELLLHMPMQPLAGDDPGPGALRIDQSDAEIERLLVRAFASVPGAEGVNNHMGSKASADTRLMTDVLAFVKRHDGYFVDSRTTPLTVSEGVAARLSVPFLKRDEFIDNERDPADILRSIEKGSQEAASRGSSILIGHIHTPQILDILKRELPAFENAKIRLASLKEILK